MADGACWKQVWREMPDAELEDRLFTYRWLSFHSPNAHAAGWLSSSRKRNDAAMRGW